MAAHALGRGLLGLAQWMYRIQNGLELTFLCHVDQKLHVLRLRVDWQQHQLLIRKDHFLEYGSSHGRQGGSCVDHLPLGSQIRPESGPGNVGGAMDDCIIPLARRTP
ncbi:hypothetical protein OPV22_000458 [Ensete ventricosum]|uniref:Secreted protein n=1 Tax=Ensete ventricosum TaxID=4639 RepID=A0AAV8RVJ0_ENSVE|nr:hypothetical protein OPV22_000458 [Ensete ventricosum]